MCTIECQDVHILYVSLIIDGLKHIIVEVTCLEYYLDSVLNHYLGLSASNNRITWIANPPVDEN